jgi:hypothetical protein
MARVASGAIPRRPQGVIRFKTVWGHHLDRQLRGTLPFFDGVCASRVRCLGLCQRAPTAGLPALFTTRRDGVSSSMIRTCRDT